MPNSMDEALTALSADSEAILWGGGTASTILMKQSLLVPSVVVGLEHIRELYGITRGTDGSIHLGGMTRLREIELSPLLADVVPSLSETARVIANVRIRNVATLGGHLVHADPAQDLPPILLALEARVNLQSSSGVRTVPLSEFFVDTFETTIRHDEILTGVSIPADSITRNARYVKFRARSQDDYCTVGVAASLGFHEDGRTVREAALAVGGAGPTASRYSDAEMHLIGKRITESLLNEVAEIVREQVEPWDDARGTEAYKRDMSAVWLKRVISSLTQQSKSRETIA